MPMPARRVFRLLAACSALAIVPAAAFADAGIPLLACISPGFWLVLPAVVLVEAVVAFVILRRGTWVALKVSAVSNLASTLVGMVLSRLLVLVLIPLASQVQTFAPRGHVPATLLQKFAFNVVSAPMGLGTSPDRWSTEVMLCWAILLVPFFLLSVWVEWWVARRMLRKEDRGLATRWAWCANIVSYALILGMFWRLFGLTWWWLERPFTP